MHSLEQSTNPVVAIAPKIVGSTTALAGVGVKMDKYNNFAMICMLKELAANGIDATFYIAESTDNSTFSTSYLKTCTLASNTETAQVDTIEVRADELSDGYYYVRGEVKMTATNTYQPAAAAGVQFNPRFK